MKKVTLLFLFLATLIACEKEETPKDPPPAIPESVEIVLKVDEISSTTVSLSGDVEYTGTPPREVGILYSQKDTEEELTVTIPLDGNSFTTTLTGLTHNTSYELKAYAKQNEKTFYSSERSITTESGIFEGAIELNTQEEIDEFGDQGYVEITGKLTINENTPKAITSLEPLNTLQKVSSFTITNLSSLTNLDGLQNLSSTGAIHISETQKLENIQALSGITSELMFLHINGNTNLTSLEGLENIPFAQQVEIKNNNALPNLKGLEGLQEVHDLLVWSNDAIISFDGLKFKKAEEVSIWQNRNLTSISELNSLENLIILQIHENPKLASLTGLENLKSIDGYFSIVHNSSLTHLDAFSNLEPGNLGAAIVASNRNLIDFCGIQHLLEALGADSFSIMDNKYNPKAEDFQNGDCKL